MKHRCPHCKYKDSDKVYDKAKKKYVDLKQIVRCYQVDAPTVELCPKCKAVL